MNRNLICLAMPGLLLRLTNWDSARVASLVRPGTAVVPK